MHHRSYLCQEQSFTDGTIIPNISFSLCSMKKLKTSDTLITNLKTLMKVTKMTKDQVALKSGVSSRMISYVLAGEKTPSIEIAEALGKAFGLSGWHMIMPSLPYDLAKSGKLDELVRNYAASDEEGRDFLNKAAQREAKHKV